MDTHANATPAADLPSLIAKLDKASTGTEHTATAWAAWARDAVALRARMPGLPLYIDPDGVEWMRPVGNRLDYDRMRTAMDNHIAAADHYAAAYARHATALHNALVDALEDHYPPPEDLPTAKTTHPPTGTAGGER